MKLELLSITNIPFSQIPVVKITFISSLITITSQTNLSKLNYCKYGIPLRTTDNEISTFISFSVTVIFKQFCWSKLRNPSLTIEKYIFITCTAVDLGLVYMTESIWPKIRQNKTKNCLQQRMLTIENDQNIYNYKPFLLKMTEKNITIELTVHTSCYWV